MSQNSLIPFFLFLLSIATSCKTAENTTINTESNITASKQSTDVTNYVQTIILKFSKSENDSIAKIEIAKTIKTAGLMKGNHGFKSGHDHANYTVEVVDGAANVLLEFEIEDPLVRTMEYVNEDGEFMKKTVLLKEDFSSLRMNYEESAQYLKIYQAHTLIAKVSLK